MKKNIYIDGELADEIGRIQLETLANQIATIANKEVYLLTHGESEFHEHRRYIGRPAEEA